MTSIAPKKEQLHLTYLVAQMVKRLPAMWETRVQSLGREEPLEKKMASHPTILMGNLMDTGAWWVPVHAVAKD